MEHPDFTAQAGKPGAVSWQVKDGAAEAAQFGEQVTAVATGRLFGAEPEIAPFDRVRFDGALWEVRSVTQWPKHRKVTVVQL
jgi:membrane protein implicated in regulation of membrane protease activity